MGIVNNVLAGASGNQGYFLSRSLRFRASASAYLSRTPAGASNRTTWTFSAWIKRGNLGSFNTILSAGSNNFVMRYNVNGAAADGIEIYEYNGSSFVYNLGTTVQYRDPSAWYHVVFALDTTQATNTNRMKLYVNGVQVTAFSAINYPSQNATGTVNSTSLTAIGQGVGIGAYFDGYMTEINFIDGQALTPSSFGMNDPATGVWEPKKYTGTYGTNGFYLPFTDNSNNTATTIGKDFSGNGNNWTPNNISVTAGATYDSMTDVPTLTSPTAANYATLNPLQTGSYVTASNANLTLTGNTSTNSAISAGTISFTSGKYYYEYTQGTVQSETCGFALVPITGSLIDGETFADSRSGGFGARASGSTYGAAKIASSLTSWTNGDVVGIAIDADNGAAYWSKNGVWQTSGVPTSGASKTGAVAGWTPTSSTIVTPFFGAYNTGFININFGQRPFAYTPPSGFVALNTFNLPTPTIGATASSQANRYMDISLYTGNGASSRTVSGLNFQPDFVWLKGRSTALVNGLFNAVTGVNRFLVSNSTNAELVNEVDGYLSAFNSDGFTLSAGTSSNGTFNLNGTTFVGWNWKANGSGSTNTAGSITSTVSANTTAGFSIVAYTGNGTNGATVGHGLGVKPKLIIEKGRTSAYNWSVQGCGELWTPATSTLFLNTSNALNASGAIAAPTSTVFTPSAVAYANESGVTNIAYVFAEVAGYSRFGSYTGNGSSDGPFVFTGFRPRYVMLKRTDTTGDWVVLDAARNTFNAETKMLYPNLADAEVDVGAILDFLSNGFKLRFAGGASINTNGGTYIFAAFAESPFKYSLAR